MSNNIFLTGKKNTGKTTIIKKVVAELNLATGGFMVGRDQSGSHWSSFYLLPASIYLDNNREKIKKLKEKGTFAWKDSKKRIKIESNVFDNYGTKLLNKDSKEDIIIMDELGRFELKAYNFQNKVIDLIKSNIPVLGVIKPEKNFFLDKVRRKLDQKPVLVTKENRKDIYNFVLKELKKWRLQND